MSADILSGKCERRAVKNGDMVFSSMDVSFVLAITLAAFNNDIAIRYFSGAKLVYGHLR